MIIVKTKTGDTFVNDKEMLEFIFDRERSEVYIYRESKCLPCRKIGDVESVAYTSDTQQTFYQCENSIVKRQNERIEQQNAEIQRLNDKIQGLNYMHCIFLNNISKIEKTADIILNIHTDDRDYADSKESTMAELAGTIKDFIEEIRDKLKEFQENEKPAQ